MCSGESKRSDYTVPAQVHIPEAENWCCELLSELQKLLKSQLQNVQRANPSFTLENSEPRDQANV